MDKEAIINELIEQHGWSEDDREVLNGKEEDFLKGLIPEKKEAAKPEKNEDTPAEKPQKPEANEDAPAVKPETIDEYINNAPEGMRDVLRSSVAEHNSAKAALIEKISTNKRNPFSKEFLESKGLDELKGIAKLATNEEDNEDGKHTPMFRSDYSGQAPAVTGNAEEEPLSVPKLDFGS